MESPASPRRPRADAARNRQRLLTAAADVFAAGGTDAPLEHVARRAGVGIGTLYGHFPTRRVLIAALLAERNRELFAHGDRLGESAPATALAAWIRAVVEHAAGYRGLAQVLAEGLTDGASALHEDCVRMNDIGAGLVERARRAGAIRGDITAEDIFALINAVAWTREYAGPEQARRLIALSLDGVLAGTGTTGSG